MVRSPWEKYVKYTEVKKITETPCTRCGWKGNMHFKLGKGNSNSFNLVMELGRGGRTVIESK